MGLSYDNLRAGMKDAREQIERADSICDDIAEILVGRLRAARISNHVLIALKRELKFYNIQQRRWREPE